MRLQKFLAEARAASRRRAAELIRTGAVRVNRVVVTAPGAEVDPEQDRIEVGGRHIRRERPRYRVWLKPRRCLATTLAVGSRPTLARTLEDAEVGWTVVVPLDYPAEGVVLLTTDGALAAAMSRGGGKVPMTYHLKLQGAVGAPELDRLRRGWKWMGHGVRTLAVERVATTGKNTWIELVAAESRPRVLRAAGESIRRSLLKVSRVRLGSISFESIPMGGCRNLSASEVADLRRAAGLA